MVPFSLLTLRHGESAGPWNHPSGKRGVLPVRRRTGELPRSSIHGSYIQQEARLTGCQKNGSSNESITCYRRRSSCFECFFLRAIYQLPVGERRRFQDALQRVPEHVRVVAVVEPPLHLFQVAIQVLGADLVEGPDNGALEQRPDALDTIGVNIADHPFVCGVVHCFVARVAVGDAQLGLQLVCVNGFGVVAQVFLDESVQRLAFYIGNPGQADLPAPLESPGHPCLAFAASGPHVFLLTSNQGFVNFDNSEQRRTIQRIVAHRFPDAVAQIPCRLVRTDPERALHLAGRDSLSGFEPEIDSDEPLAKRQVRIVHDGSGSRAELVLASEAGPLVALGNLAHFPAIAMRTSVMNQNSKKKRKRRLPHNTIERPDSEIMERIFGKRVKRELDKIAGKPEAGAGGKHLKPC